MSMQARKTQVETVYRRTLHFFQEICKIPHESGNEEAIADFLVDFAKKENLPFLRTTDVINGKQTHNVIITKPGSVGYESLEPLVLQAHMDMVCQKVSDSTHNFATDPLPVRIEGDKMMADGTTLGADDGIGVACMLAFLESKEISHPPLEALFTSDEEEGMSGAMAITEEMLKGRRLINIDSGEEGIFTYGCAGGLNADVTLPISYEPTPVGYDFLGVEISGLQGGHSGAEIHKGHANAHKLLGRVLDAMQRKSDIRLVSLWGGDKRNVITREAGVVVCVPMTEISDLKEVIAEQQAIFLHEYESLEPTIVLSAKEALTARKVLSKDTTTKLITLLLAIPNDVHSMHNNVAGLVGTSCNLGLISQEENHIFLSSHIRSFHDSKKWYVYYQIKRLAEAVGASCSHGSDYPHWEPNLNSDLMKRFRVAFAQTFPDKTPRFESIHAGLECGFISKRFPTMDMISCGPDITGAHTPEETLYLDSTKRTVELLLNVMGQMKE